MLQQQVGLQLQRLNYCTRICILLYCFDDGIGYIIVNAQYFFSLRLCWLGR